MHVIMLYLINIRFKARVPNYKYVLYNTLTIHGEITCVQVFISNNSGLLLDWNDCTNSDLSSGNSLKTHYCTNKNNA